MGYDLPKIPTNPRCSDHPTKSGRAHFLFTYTIELIFLIILLRKDRMGQ